MKTGSVAKLFGIDPKTVTGWVDEFPEFFSESAKGDGLTQRSYLPEDLIVLNTIKVERAIRTEVETIRAKLASGHRDPALPPQETLNRESSVALYGQLMTLQTQIEDERRQNSSLREKIQELEQTASQLNERLKEVVNQLNREKNADVERLLEDSRNREGELREQIGELKATIRMLREQMEKNDQ
jgi:DNA-binding transcriptional MerR regulator